MEEGKSLAPTEEAMILFQMLIILDLKYKANSLHFCEEEFSGYWSEGIDQFINFAEQKLRVIEIFANNLRKVMLSRCFHFFVIFTEQVFLENIISLQFGLTPFALRFTAGSF